jgi:hypothetical protein
MIFIKVEIGMTNNKLSGMKFYQDLIIKSYIINAK